MADKKPELFIIAGPQRFRKNNREKEIIAEKWGTDGVYKKILNLNEID